VAQWLGGEVAQWLGGEVAQWYRWRGGSLVVHLTANQ
jgi:hypothetical protein